MSETHPPLKEQPSSSNSANGDAFTENFGTTSKNGESSVPKSVHEAVQDVVNSIHYSKATDECVASVVQSLSDTRRYSKYSITAPMENGADDMEPPPKLFAMDHRYRRRRKRRVFSVLRRPTRRFPIKSDRSPTKAKNAIAETNGEKLSIDSKNQDRSIDVKIHSSVFSPDQCGFVKSAKTQKRPDSDPKSIDDRTSSCCRASLNEKILPHLIAFNNGELSQAKRWSVETVTAFVKALPSCPATVAEKFREEMIDGEAFLLLTQDDLIKFMNIRLGPAVKIHNAIMLLKHKRLYDAENQ